MALQVTLLTPGLASQIDTFHQRMVAGFSPSMKCALNGPDVPALEWLRACIVEQEPRHEVAVALDGIVWGGLIVVRLSDNTILWEVLNANFPGGPMSVVTAFTAWTLDRYGISQGVVENETVRAAMVAAHPSIKAKGNLVVWEP